MRNEIQVAGQQTGIKLRPYEHHAKYYETDQMGIIHHSNYVKWMEEARMDLINRWKKWKLSVRFYPLR